MERDEINLKGCNVSLSERTNSNKVAQREGERFENPLIQMQ
jgi:hypothetical protein